MKKDIVYSIRMSPTVREALKRAAKKERRTVASLLDMIILDYLEKEGFVLAAEIGAERRRHERKKITLPATSVVQVGSDKQSFPCVILNISKDSVLVAYPKGSSIQFSSRGKLPRFELFFELPQTAEEVHFRCEARRMIESEDGIQVGAAFKKGSEDSLKKLETYLA